ncbi:MAG: ISNCY family transposase [Rhodospirillales bacterium]|nr:ISNCY family transposase [Rhodospirillales bacterium]MBX3518267.1 ISNCY family transposase [Rhodospirillales bacterium]
MGRAGVLQEIRRMRFEALLDRHERGELSQVEAAEMLGMSERTFRRWRDRLKDEGPEGLCDRRIGKPSNRRAAAEEILRMLDLWRDHYADFTVKHFHEQLVKRHGYKLGYTVTKLHLHRSGLVRPAPRRSAHRKKRPRRPMAGMLLHQDASRHDWLDGAPPLDLVVTLDDATSEIYSAFLVAEEATASSFRGLAEVVAVHGLFCALYTDRGSHYFHTPAAGGKVSRALLTQVGRALAQLGIEHIAAYSPEARGRSERAFRTLQDRLPKELRLAGISDVETANRWLAEVYLPAYNARFAVAAEQNGSAFVADPAQAWRDVLCIQEERVVGNDNTVKWKRLSLQIPPSPLRPHFVRAKVRVLEYPDGRLAVFWGPHRLADYDALGTITDAHALAA